MVRFVLGRRKSGKSQYLYEEIKRKMAEGESVILLVPEQSTLDVENRVIASMGTKGTLDLQIISFEKLGNTLLKQSKARHKKLLKSQGQKMILRNALKGLPLVYFKQALSKEGVLEKLLDMVNEMRDGQIGATSLDFLEDNHPLKGKLLELVLIKEAYETFLPEGYMDEVEGLYLQKEVLEKHHLLKNTHLFIDEFFAFTLNQIELIHTLFEQCQSVTISLPYDHKDQSFFEPIGKLYHKLKILAQETGRGLEIHTCETSYYDVPVLGFIEENLTRYQNLKFAGSLEGFQLKEVANPDLEVREAFDAIGVLLRQGVPLGKIKILCNDLKTYGPLFKLYREIYGYPIFIDEQIAIHNHPVVRLVLLLLELSEGLTTKKVLDLLKTGYFSFAQEEIERLEIFTRENGIENYQWQYTFYDEEVEEIRQKVLALFSFKEDLKKLKTYREKISYFYSYLETLEIYEQLKERIDGYKASGDYRSLYIDTQIWNLLLDTFDQCVMFLGSVEGNSKSLANILKSSLKTEMIKILPTALEEIEILNSRALFKESIPYLFIIGASEGVFPGVVEKESLFLRSELKLLEEPFNWQKSQRWKYKERRLEAYFSMTAATKNLYISYSLGNRKGEGQTLSYPVKQLLRQLPQLLKTYALVESPEKVLISENKGFLDLMEGIGKGQVKTFEANLLTYFKKTSRGQFLEDYFTFEERSKDEGIIPKSLVENLFFPGDWPGFSVSKLETYGSCPYAFFVKYGLKPLKYNGYALNQLNIGTIYHEALELFQKNYLHKNLEDVLINSLGDELFQKVYESYGFDLKYQKESSLYRLEKIKEIGIKNFSLLLEQAKQDHFKPTYFELAFGKKSLLGPIEMKVEHHRIALEGKIDRVDFLSHEGAMYAKVMDFKLNEKQLDYSKFYEGISLQLFFYMNALMKKSEQIFKGVDLEPGALLYFPLNESRVHLDVLDDLSKGPKAFRLKGEVLDQKEIIEQMAVASLPVSFTKDQRLSKTSSVLSKEEFNRCLHHVEKQSEHLLSKIYQGDYRAYPYYYKDREEKYCKYCDYFKLCKNKSRFNYLTHQNKETVLSRLEEEEK